MSAAATLPAGLLYWGLLPADAARTAAPAQAYRFERVLPVPIESVHAVRAALPGVGVLFAAIEPERLRAHLAGRGDLGPGTWELLPDALPAHLLAAGVPDAARARLNLLQGEFEPEPRRRARRGAVRALAGGLLAAALLVVVGVERRAAAAQARSAEFAQARQALFARLLPEPQPGLRPELQVTMELRRLEQATRGAGQQGPDLVGLLEALWARWPAAQRVALDTVSAEAERVVLRGRVPTLADAERLAQACGGLAVAGSRFRAEPIQAQDGEHGATFLLTLVRQAGAAPAP